MILALAWFAYDTVVFVVHVDGNKSRQDASPRFDGCTWGRREGREAMWTFRLPAIGPVIVLTVAHIYCQIHMVIRRWNSDLHAWLFGLFRVLCKRKLLLLILLNFAVKLQHLSCLLGYELVTVCWRKRRKSLSMLFCVQLEKFTHYLNTERLKVAYAWNSKNHDIFRDRQTLWLELSQKKISCSIVIFWRQCRI